MKVQAAVDRGRKMLDDVDKQTWEEDSDFLDWYNDSVMVIRKLRKDTQLAADGTAIVFVASTSVSGDDMLFAEPDAWVIACAEYIAHRGFGEDSGDKRDLERSEHHWNNFSRYIEML